MKYHVIITTEAGWRLAMIGDTIEDIINPLGMEITGEHRNQKTRSELQGQPVIKGLHGSMWGGLTQDHEPIILYEDPETYASVRP